MKKRKANVIKMEDFCHEKGIVHASTMTPDIYMIQIHIQNMEATYGKELVQEVINNLGYNKAKKQAA